SQHFGGKLLSVFTCIVIRLSVGMVFGKVAIGRRIGWDGDSDGSGQQAMRFVRSVFTHHTKDNLTGMKKPYSLCLGNDLTSRGKYARDTNQIIRSQACIAQGHLETREFLLMLSNTLRQKDSFCNEHRS